ncbi:MAG TPA: M48 family peptidase [Candidatus Dormibacteraeota bacterium]|nr:M48 family peptidase [Candidatus Dormibacteraeota bacterium]
MFVRKRARPVCGGAQTFQRMFTRLGIQGRPPRFEVEWFPYANLVHTIRLREDTAYVRVSDVLQRAPQEVLAAAAALLLARLYRHRAPRDLQEIYRGFVEASTTRRRIERLRMARGRRVCGGPQGAVHNLAALFTRLNQHYFSGALRQPDLGWSARAWRRQLGIFDSGIQQIVLNRRLDRVTVPGCAVEYVLYHEMLHVKHPVRRAACGLQAHSPEFRRAEKRFAEYDKARKILARLA